ncbi:hypothetical protein EMPS_08790 [Entomortierella parvispora]|uniref:Uncharacterized protein n=1 Tax=Entomortierella parvispora TaxID=205924 RepID=A0A9P3HH05_9FUNG|nr:hypothetical protein EMPS_08790 [Entomortierella parvispora]
MSDTSDQTHVEDGYQAKNINLRSGRESSMSFHSDKISHDNTDLIGKLFLMARGVCPIDSDNKMSKGNGFIRTMIANITDSGPHPIVAEAVSQDFLGTREYPDIAECAVRYHSVPKPGGIEIMTLSSLPECGEIKLEDDKKSLSAVFNRTEYWLPMNDVSQEELYCLVHSASLRVPRLSIDISTYGSFYAVNMDGGVGQGTIVAKTMERAFFQLCAMAFGRDAHSGALFEPKRGQLADYKNPVLEEAKLLKEDAQYAAARCQYISARPYPTLIYNTPFSLPAPGWLDIWPKLEFPKSYVRVTWRLVLVDLFGRSAFYDVPVTNVEAEAEILLRPYKALMESVRKHGAEWIDSEPDLCKVNMYAKIFHLLSRARSSSGFRNFDIPFNIAESPKSFSATVVERADFFSPSPLEIDSLGQELESALTLAVVNNPDDLTRAAQYRRLGMSCLRLNKLDKATLHFLQAAKMCAACLQHRLSDPKSSRAIEAEYAKEGIRDNFVSVLETIYQMPTDWVFQRDVSKRPPWWKALQDQFGDALCIIATVLEDHFFLSMGERLAQSAAPLVVHVLLVQLAHEMLAEFEELQDLDGIRWICEFMAQLYGGMEKRGIAVSTRYSESSEYRWPSIELASLALKRRLFDDTHPTDPFTVLERVLQGDTAGSFSFNKEIQQQGKSSDTTRSPALDAVCDTLSSSQHISPDGKVMQAERTMDFYFIQGDIAASLACALVLANDEEYAKVSTFSDRARFWTKARVVAEYASAQQSLMGAKQLIQGVRSTLDENNYQTSLIGHKAALLYYLTKAHDLLDHSRRPFPRAPEILRGLVYSTMASVHEAWFDSKTASRWTVAAGSRGEVAGSWSDDLGARMYAQEWLLDAKSQKKESALKCTKEWQDMVKAMTELSRVPLNKDSEP